MIGLIVWFAIVVDGFLIGRPFAGILIASLTMLLMHKILSRRAGAKSSPPHTGKHSS